jgi:hypothetical protein
LENSEELFPQYQNMLRSAAWKASKTWGLDYEDLEAQSYLIFTDAVKRFESNRGASFSTFLYYRLKTINDYCEQEVTRTGCLLPILEDCAVDLDFTKFCNTLDILESQTILSPDAQEVLRYILFEDWGSFFKRKNAMLSFDSLKKIYHTEKGWRPVRIKRVLHELQVWYNECVA